ncbi:hypothetical protein L596_016145 [Steinernema carpocapsae]|uniref:Septin-type G domain-containing protein n=1 Tax=Steinernema carpocapsae TaxID=34508 RepID=A0A4U5NHX5_STECR|nr:hypothetical protein L596_016145 [Steinernema carpocapsae]
MEEKMPGDETSQSERRKVSALCQNFELLLNKKTTKTAPSASVSNSLLDLSSATNQHVSTVPIGTHTTRIPISASSSTSAIPIYTVLSGRLPEEPKTSSNPPLVKQERQESISESEVHSDSSGSCDIIESKDFDTVSEDKENENSVENPEEAEEQKTSMVGVMEAKKMFQKAPANPPPPVPSHSKPSVADTISLNGSIKNAAHCAVLDIDDGHPATLKLNGFVGFDSLPYQLVEKCNGQGFQFNLMCVGETGMGKTTLIESLFNMKLEFEPCNHELKTVELRSKTCEVSEGNVHVKLKIVETAGFGDQLDKDKSAKVIVDYINDQFEKYLIEELKVKRDLAYFDDSRIHACLYFISPTGHGLKALDVVTMRELAKRVNVIPVIAKADTTCKDELVRFKQKILDELRSHNITIYQFPTDDDTVRQSNEELNKLMPYAVVGSTDFVTKENGKSVRARKYPWGIVEVENEEHCDFVKLREAVLRINVDSLRERTHTQLYEGYRRDRLREMKLGDGDAGLKMMESLQIRQSDYKERNSRLEKEYNEEFINRVSRKEEELKGRDEMLATRHKEMQEKFHAEMDALDRQIATLLEEKHKLETRTLSKKKDRK